MKVYVIEVGEYSDRYIDAIFTTRELAEAYVENHAKEAWEHELRTIESTDPVVRRFYASPYAGYTYEQFREVLKYRFGTIEEYELWDVLPVVEAA